MKTVCKLYLNSSLPSECIPSSQLDYIAIVEDRLFVLYVSFHNPIPVWVVVNNRAMKCKRQMHCLVFCMTLLCENKQKELFFCKQMNPLPVIFVEKYSLQFSNIWITIHHINIDKTYVHLPKGWTQWAHKRRSIFSSFLIIKISSKYSTKWLLRANIIRL